MDKESTYKNSAQDLDLSQIEGNFVLADKLEEKSREPEQKKSYNLDPKLVYITYEG